MMADDVGDLRVALYARVSSDQQANAGTIGGQVAAIEERVRADGLSLESEFRFLDDGYSGTTLVRPGMEKLRDAAAQGQIDRLYVLAPDRLSRNYAYQVLVVEELQRNGVEVCFLNQGLGDSPESKLLVQVQGMIAEFGRAKILESMRRGKLYWARRGSAVAIPSAPYGYRYAPPACPGGLGSYVVSLEEAVVVKRIFEGVAKKRLSIGAVCRSLDSDGIASPKGNAHWDRKTVWGILRNAAYKGTAAFGKTRSGPRRAPVVRPVPKYAVPMRTSSTYRQPEDEWVTIPVPAIVSEDLFSAVGEQLAENRRRARERKAGAKTLLRGLVLCGKCGYAVSAVGCAAHRYYVCNGNDSRRFGGQRVCNSSGVRAEWLEDAVWADAQSLLKEPERIQREFEQRLQSDTPGAANDDIVEIERSMSKLTAKLNRLLDAFAEGLIAKPDLRIRSERIRAELKSMGAELKEKKLERDAAAELRLLVTRVDDFAKRIRAGLEGATWEQKREILRLLVKEVQLDETKIRVVYRVEPGPSGPSPMPRDFRHCGSRSGSANPRPLLRWGYAIEHARGHVPHPTHLRPISDPCLTHLRREPNRP